MKTYLNTLYVTLEGAYLRKDGAAVEIKHEGDSKLRVPLHNLEGIVSFGWNTTVSTALMAACHEAGVSLSFLNPYGKFLASSQGGVSGNILLRKEQYRRADDEKLSVGIAVNMIAAKLFNTRVILHRGVRDYPDRRDSLQFVLNSFSRSIKTAQSADTLERLRGIEGDAAAEYFAAFNNLITVPDSRLKMNGRSRRPPLDPVNALLSLVYVLLMHDCRSACETCGLDPQMGFLHQPRPGRASLALDLMEEFRPIVADRLVLSLINRKQITLKDFEIKENGAVQLKKDSRKKVLQAWQERKQNVVEHPFLYEKLPYGMLPLIQARLLARHLRGDLDAYPAFLAK